MRVLFVTNRFPGQLAHGDQLRAYQQIRQLSRRHAITLLSFGAASELRWRDEMEACCERVIVAPRNRLGMLLRAVIALAGRRPLQVAMHDALPRRAVLAVAGQFDLAHVQLVRLGSTLDRLKPLPCVLDFVDALSVNMKRRATLDRGPMRYLAKIEAPRLRDFERRLCTQATAATICSAADRFAIGDFSNLHLISNGVDLHRFPYVAPRGGAPEIVFIGNLGYFPNVDAATWFITEVMPRLAGRIPATRFSVVGAQPTGSLRRLAGRTANVDLIGPVSDVHPFLVRAAIAVVPLRAGSGQQLKILEAMAAGTPVVATSLSASSLSAVDGKHLLVADDAGSMAAAIVRLLDDPDLAGRLAVAARRLVETRYSWERSALDLEQLWVATAGGEATRT